MESPAKGDSRQGLKASQKHMEFHLQREKAYSRELEERIKTQQAQIAKLEQDKAELRREKLTLLEEDKKKTKIEERCHTLQRELVEKQTALVAEQKRTLAAESEREQIRRDAHSSIAKWREAEKQWISENDALQKDLHMLKEENTKLKNEIEEITVAHREALKQLQSETNHTTKLEALSEAADKKIASLHSQIEALKNEIYSRDETLLKLDSAGTKWQEICHAKDEEVKALELQLAKHEKTVENLQNTITKLNQQIEAEKLCNIEERGNVERVTCDLRRFEKENKELRVELETLRRDIDHASINSTKHQELITELRSKLLSLTELLKEKNTEIRKQELTISELTAEVQRVEREHMEGNYVVSSLESRLQKLQSELDRNISIAEDLQHERSHLESELQLIKASRDTKDETLVLMKAEYEEKIESLLGEIRNLESDIGARQNVINNITEQMSETNKKNEELYGKFIRDADCLSQLHSALEAQLDENGALVRRILVLEEEATRFKSMEDFGSKFAEMLLMHCDKVSIMLSVCFGDIMKQKDAAKLFEFEKEQLVTSLAAAESKFTCQINEFLDRENALIDALKDKNDELCTSLKKLECCEEELRLLKEKANIQKESYEELKSNEKILLRNIAEMENRLNESSANSMRALRSSCFVRDHFKCFVQSAILLFDDVESYLFAKADIGFTMLMALNSERSHAIKTAFTLEKTLRKNAEEACTQLQIRVGNVELCCSEYEKKIAHLRDDFALKISDLEEQRNNAGKSNEILAQKIISITDHYREELMRKDNEIKELSQSLSIERRNVQFADHKTQKLRNALSYELTRKGEYKRALKEVKSKREEVDRYRATEKDWAMKAINRVNEEVNYWVKSFDKLKSMLDNLFKKTGSLPSVTDERTIQELEEARNNLAQCSDGLRHLTSSEENYIPEKRHRTEL
ncbi:hypothetical protein TRVL_07360 [Trypanosoma vivax]|nr:hypothetical protein TRVL_07360 [Trypanosoma vivax]